MSRSILAALQQQITRALRAAEPAMRSTARKQLIRTIGALADSGELTEPEARLAIIHLVATNAWHERKKK